MNIRRAYALPILFILLTVSSVTVFGQSDRQTVVNIPFDFIVGDKAMSAGRYILERNKRENDTVWSITSKDTGASRKAFLTVPSHSLGGGGKSEVVLRRFESCKLLTSFTVAGSNTGRELQKSDRERNPGEKLIAQ